MAWIPGIDELGSGYDYLNGQYAQSESCTENLFDWNNVPTYKREHNGQTYIIPSTVSVRTFIQRERFEYITVAGENLGEYHQSISNTVNVGASILGFTCSLDIELGTVIDYSKFQKFSRIQYDYSSHLLHLTSSLLTSLKMGGHVVLSAFTNKLNYNSKPNFKMNSDFNLNDACGGDVSALGNDMMYPNMDKWTETVPNNPVFITFERTKSLSFIGDLAEDETRRKQFIDAWPIYANVHRREFKSFDLPYLEYTYVTSTTSASRIENHEGKVLNILGTMPVFKEESKWKWLAVS
ncbi:hypothetical protein C2G38_2166926 [Gigaspora rosea]|uniref:Uncharacterized protein n=1 Tax=Gigaspora rosea TaxID=44941 RepID=A0A397VUI6_9GLOM|nr:hypothetical protein C2G38_2166926 [Gigaspora rosea]